MEFASLAGALIYPKMNKPYRYPANHRQTMMQVSLGKKGGAGRGGRLIKPPPPTKWEVGRGGVKYLAGLVNIGVCSPNPTSQQSGSNPTTTTNQLTHRPQTFVSSLNPASWFKTGDLVIDTGGF